MPNQPAKHKLGETCPSCEIVHTTTAGKPSCVGHSTRTGRGCRKHAEPGLNVCDKHGGATGQAQAAGQRRDTEGKARAALEALGGEGTPVTDPVATLCAIAGRAVKLMEDFGARVAELALPEAGISSSTAHVEIRAYQLAIERAAGIVESIIRMGIAERFAKQNAEAVAAYVACLDAIVTDLGHNPRDPEVAGVIARRLELVG